MRPGPGLGVGGWEPSAFPASLGASGARGPQAPPDKRPPRLLPQGTGRCSRRQGAAGWAPRWVRDAPRPGGRPEPRTCEDGQPRRPGAGRWAGELPRAGRPLGPREAHFTRPCLSGLNGRSGGETEFTQKLTDSAGCAGGGVRPGPPSEGPLAAEAGDGWRAAASRGSGAQLRAPPPAEAGTPQQRPAAPEQRRAPPSRGGQPYQLRRATTHPAPPRPPGAWEPDGAQSRGAAFWTPFLIYLLAAARGKMIQ